MFSNAEIQKKAAALAALKYVTEKLFSNDTVIGVGTGSTVNYFIAELAAIKHKIAGAVASSVATENKLKEFDIPVYDLNSVSDLPWYIDGADEINAARQMIKGGGGALTREKIVAAVAKKFICIADAKKKVDVLGQFPLPIEVIPMARSYVARELVKIGGTPVYRNGFVTDNGNVILDVWNLQILEPIKLEQQINNMAGVVTVGIFAQRTADILFLGTEEGIQRL